MTSLALNMNLSIVDQRLFFRFFFWALIRSYKFGIYLDGGYLLLFIDTLLLVNEKKTPPIT